MKVQMIVLLTCKHANISTHPASVHRFCIYKPLLYIICGRSLGITFAQSNLQCVRRTLKRQWQVTGSFETGLQLLNVLEAGVLS